MTTIHRELTRRFLWNLLRAQFVFMLVVVSFRIPSSLDADPAAITPDFVLQIADSVLPLALLVATLFTMGSMARDHELVALRAVGRSMVQITLPLIAVGGVAVAFSAALRWTGSVQPAMAQTVAARDVAIHSRWAYPLVNLLAVAVGVALASTPRAASRFVGFGRALVLLAAYYVASAVAAALGNIGFLHPAVAGWAATVVFAGLGGVLWWRLEH